MDRERVRSGEPRTRPPSGTADPRVTSAYYKKKKTWSQVFCEAVIATLLRVGLVALLVAYAFCGAGIFHLIERPNQLVDLAKKKNESVELVNMEIYSILEILRTVCANTTGHENSERKSLSTIACHATLKDEIMKIGTLPILVDESYPWDIWHALFYCGTVFTTIGYGQMTCKTMLGQIVTMFYAVVGIPLTLTVLNDIGKSLYRGFLRIYRWNRRLVRKIVTFIYKVKYGEPPKQLNRMSTLNIGDNFDSPQLPIWLAFFIVITYMLFCSAIMLTWEEKWNYHTAFYFVFVSLSTIGFGDVIPDHLNFMLAASVLILIGLSLVSMCINVIQAKLEYTYRLTYDSMQGNFATGEYLCSPASVLTPGPGYKDSGMFTICGNPDPIHAVSPKPYRADLEPSEPIRVQTPPRRRAFLPRGSLGIISVGSIVEDEEQIPNLPPEDEANVRWRRNTDEGEKGKY